MENSGALSLLPASWWSGPTTTTPLPVALALLFAGAVLVLVHRRSALFAGARPPRGVPTPQTTLPLLGNALEIVRNRHRLHDWLLDKTLELGSGRGAAAADPAAPPPSSISSSIFPRTWAFTTPFNPLYLVISSPAALEHVLSAKGMQTYVKGPEFSARLGQLLGSGIFTADGAHWRWQRKLAAHLFSGVRFRDYVASAFAQSVEHLFDALEPYCSRGGGEGGGEGGGNGEGSGSSAVVDLHALMYDLTLDTFARVGFGIELGMLEEAAAEARRRRTNRRTTPTSAATTTPAATATPPAACIINGVSGREFARAFDEAQRLANRRFWLPLWRLCERVTGDARRVQEDVEVVRRFAEGIVRQRRQLLDKEAGLATRGKMAGGKEQVEEDARPDLLTLFMRPGALASSAAARFGGGGGGNGGGGNEAAGDQQRGGAGQVAGADELTDAEVVDAVLNFIIASRDTTAQATSWAFYELMRHPDAEAKLLQEAKEVLGGGKGGGKDGGKGDDGAPDHQPQQRQRHPSYDELRRLRYARAVFLETVRLHPSIPQDAKYCSRPGGDVLPDGTPVPEGSLMLYSPWVACRLPSFWGEDAAEFRPERWLKGSSGGGGVGGGGGEDGGGNGSGGGTGAGFLAPSPYQFPAFNAGPRLCLGRGFAELEGVYALVETLRRFRFALAEGREGDGEGGGSAEQRQREITYEQSTSLPMLGGLKVRVLPRC
jgi:cytochrome P450